MGFCERRNLYNQVLKENITGKYMGGDFVFFIEIGGYQTLCISKSF